MKKSIGKSNNLAQIGRGRRLNVCFANFTLNEVKQPLLKGEDL